MTPLLHSALLAPLWIKRKALENALEELFVLLERWERLRLSVPPGAKEASVHRVLSPAGRPCEPVSDLCSRAGTFWV